MSKYQYGTNFKKIENHLFLSIFHSFSSYRPSQFFQRMRLADLDSPTFLEFFDNLWASASHKAAQQIIKCGSNPDFNPASTNFRQISYDFLCPS